MIDTVITATSGALLTAGLLGRWGGLSRRTCRLLLIAADCAGVTSNALDLPGVGAVVGVAFWTFALIMDIRRLRNDDDDDGPRGRRRRLSWRPDWSKLTLPGALQPAGAAACVASLAVLAGCATPRPAAGILLTGPQAELAALTIAPENGAAQYRRADWGTWAQHGRGCDTREQVLSDQGDSEVTDATCHPECPATAPPCWTSPYDGIVTGNPAALQIDHLVPLAEAAHSGADSWTAARRHAYYNDPDNLVAVTIHANTSKGDRDPGEWKPPARDSWCRYAAGWTHVKVSYGLSADPAERDALAVMLATCP